MTRISSTLEQNLIDRFGGALLIRPVDAGGILGRDKGTVYNQVSGGTFPVPLVLEGTRRMVKVSDLAHYIENLPSGYGVDDRPVLSDRLGQTNPHRRGRRPNAMSVGKQ